MPFLHQLMILSLLVLRLYNASNFPETFDPPTIDIKGLLDYEQYDGKINFFCH